MHQAQSVNIKRLTWGCHNFYCIRKYVYIKHFLVHVMISIASEKLSISKQLLVHVMISIASDFSVFLHVLKHLDGLSTYPRTCPTLACFSVHIALDDRTKESHANLELQNCTHKVAGGKIYPYIQIWSSIIITKTIVGSKNHSLTLWSSRFIPKKMAGNKNHTSAFEEAQQPYPKDSWKQKPYFHIWTSSMTIRKR